MVFSYEFQIPLDDGAAVAMHACPLVRRINVLIYDSPCLPCIPRPTLKTLRWRCLMSRVTNIIQNTARKGKPNYTLRGLGTCTEFIHAPREALSHRWTFFCSVFSNTIVCFKRTLTKFHTNIGHRTKPESFPSLPCPSGPRWDDLLWW